MLFNKIPEEKREIYLKELLDYIVDKNGLASVPKADIEACFVYLYKKHVDSDCDLYTLSKIFKVKESKLKSLMELFYLKFPQDDDIADEDIFLDLIEDVKFQIESVERVQISFQFSKIESYPIIQSCFRKVKGSVKFDRSSESIVINQNRLYEVLDYIWELKPKEDLLKERKVKIQKIIGNIGSSIDEELRKKLREKKTNKLYQALQYASTLAGIGSSISGLCKDVLKIDLTLLNT